MVIPPKDFKAARIAAGLSLTECARGLYCTPRQISYYESGGREVDPARYELLLRQHGLTSRLRDLTRALRETKP